MRFETEYRAIQAPQFSPHYIKYGALKFSIKAEHGLARKEGRSPKHLRKLPCSAPGDVLLSPD